MKRGRTVPRSYRSMFLSIASKTDVLKPKNSSFFTVPPGTFTTRFIYPAGWSFFANCFGRRGDAGAF